jgi:hypothetical protein
LWGLGIYLSTGAKRAIFVPLLSTKWTTSRRRALLSPYGSMGQLIERYFHWKGWKVIESWGSIREPEGLLGGYGRGWNNDSYEKRMG